MKYQLFVLLALSCFASSKDYDDDESRPYEFGFTIDGQQHRHESKDINGIIMGEFGFITADGVYHVTVYATDENGSFKILSMKNIKISEPLDQPGVRLPSKLPSGNPRPIKEITTTTTRRPITTTTPKAPYRFTTVPSLNIPSCSSCALPSTTPRKPGSPNKFPFQTPQFQPGYKPTPTNKPVYPGNKPNGAVYPNNGANYPNNKPNGPVYPSNKPFGGNSKPNEEDYPGNKPFQGGNYNGGNTGSKPFGQIPNNNGVGFPKPSVDQQPPFKNPSQNKIPSNPIQNYPKKPVRAPATVPPKVIVDNGMIKVPGAQPIPIKDKYPNMQDGLPAGITADDMLDLLYKFNYTIGFHGHYEKGLKNGAKIGGYFVNGRDGISRVVEYIADENGYRPKVKFINLGLDSPYTPKEGTEKTFGLQGFEFIWYPV